MDSMCGWCESAFTWIWEEFWSSVWQWVTNTIRQCTKRKCKWICLCCNKWLCWIAAVLVAIVAFIITLILTLVAIVVCAVCYIACVVLCLAGIFFGNTKIDACIERWCQGLPREAEEEPHVDPQKPGEPGPPGSVEPGGGLVAGTETVAIENASQLRTLDKWRFAIGRPTHVVLRLPGIEAKEAQKWQAVLNNQLSACGCNEGAAFMAIGVIVYLAVAATSAVSPVPWKTLLATAAGVAIAAGLVGKILGLIRARRRLARLIRQLEALTGGSSQLKGGRVAS